MPIANIASPMRLTGKDSATIDREVRKAAELMRLTPYLDRTPLSLSGGKQQRNGQHNETAQHDGSPLAINWEDSR